MKLSLGLQNKANLLRTSRIQHNEMPTTLTTATKQQRAFHMYMEGGEY